MPMLGQSTESDDKKKLAPQFQQLPTYISNYIEVIGVCDILMEVSHHPILFILNIFISQKRTKGKLPLVLKLENRFWEYGNI
jgi:hypothetical protein